MDAHDDPPDVSSTTARPTDGCSWCLGYFDGYMAGADGVDPDGVRHDYDPLLLGEPVYLDGASAGRADRMNGVRVATTT